MKKQLLLIAAFIVATLSVSAEDYASGKIAPMAEGEFVLPDFWGIEGSKVYTRALTPASFKEGFAEGLGIAADATTCQTIQMSKTDGVADDARGYSQLNLSDCGSISVTVWGTGGRGLSIRKGDIDGDQLSWGGGSSYELTVVFTEINSPEPITLFLVPTANVVGGTSGSTGDTYISEITITAYSSGSSIEGSVVAKNPVKTEYYNLLGKKFDQAQKGLNIVKVTYDDNSTDVTKAIY